MKKLKAGIIGLGVGEQHIHGYRRHPRCEVVAVCDLSSSKLKEIQGKYPGLRTTRKDTEILDDPEIGVVSIASYDDVHASQILRAIRNGKHVFVEKPACLFEGELKKIRMALRKHPQVRMSSNLILRQCPRFRWLRKQVQEGRMGRRFHVEGDYLYGRLHKITQGWRGKLDYYSVMLGGGIHVLDLLRWVTADEVVEVSAFGNRIASRGSAFRHPDMATALLKFRSGMTGKVSANFGCVHPHFHALSFHGTRATFRNERSHGLWFGSRDPGVKPRRIEKDYPGARKGDLIPGFVDLILKGTPAEVGVEDVFRSMSVCLAIDRAMREGRTVKVKYF